MEHIELMGDRPVPIYKLSRMNGQSSGIINLVARQLGGELNMDIGPFITALGLYL
jgi:hypothetical protein